MPTWPRITEHKSTVKNATKKKLSAKEKTLRSIYEDDNGDIPPMKTLERRRGGGMTFVAGFFIILLGIAGFFAWKNKDTLSLPRGEKSDTVAIGVEGPESVKILTPETWNISVNIGTISIKDATLSLFLPSGFVLEGSEPAFTETPSAKERVWKLSEQNLKERTPITVRGQFLGNLGEQKSFRAVLTYKPKNFQSEFQVNTLHTVTLAETPLQFSVTAPERIRGGESGSYTVTLKNAGPIKLIDLLIVPPTHKLFSMVNEGISFEIKDLDRNTQLSKELHGSFAGEMEGAATLDWRVTTKIEGETYTLATASTTVAVTPQPLILTIALDGNPETIAPGDTLKGEARFHNKSARAISKADVILSIDAPAKKKNSILSWDKLQVTGSPSIQGVQQSDTVRRGVITWTSATIPTLETIAPNQQGVFTFSLPIKSGDAFDLTTLDIASITLALEVKAGEETATAQPVTLPLVANTKITAGALKTGENITVQWTMNHNFHNLASVKVTANLFGTITWLDQTDASHGAVQYDAARKSVEWTIPAFAATEGVATANFTIKLDQQNPSQTALMSETVLTATDDTLKRSITRRAPELKIP